MCLAALIDGDTDRPLGELVREEVVDATVTGLLAVTFVVAVLGTQGASVGTAVASGGGAFALGVGVHLFLLLFGVAVQRRRNGSVADSAPS